MADETMASNGTSPVYGLTLRALNNISSAPSWAGISTSLLRAELERRQDDTAKPVCGSGKMGAYNTPSHVFALVLILALSTLGTFPLNIWKEARLIV